MQHKILIGIWPSPVRRLSGGQEITGSNPVIPTNSYQLFKLFVQLVATSLAKKQHGSILCKFTNRLYLSTSTIQVAISILANQRQYILPFLTSVT